MSNIAAAAELKTPSEQICTKILSNCLETPEEQITLSTIYTPNNSSTVVATLKTLDNGFLQKYDVTLYGSESDNYTIINDFLQENQSEEAFYIIDLGEILNA